MAIYGRWQIIIPYRDRDTVELTTGETKTICEAGVQYLVTGKVTRRAIESLTLTAVPRKGARKVNIKLWHDQDYIKPVDNMIYEFTSKFGYQIRTLPIFFMQCIPTNYFYLTINYKES